MLDELTSNFRLVEIVMNRWIKVAGSAVFSLATFYCALRIPAHLRAVDASVLRQAGKGTLSLNNKASALIQQNHLGEAQLLVAVAGDIGLAESETLSNSLDKAYGQPRGTTNGREGALAQLTQGISSSSLTGPFTDHIIRTENRVKALGLLTASPNPVVRSLMHFRSLTNTVVFPASSSSSGQALDASIAICGLLVEADHLSGGLSNSVIRLATDANQHRQTQPLEGFLVDLLSLGRRLNWEQLSAFVNPMETPEALRILTHYVRTDQGVPVIFTAVSLTGNATGVAHYLANFSDTGLKDLEASLKYGAGGVNELLRRNQRLCNSSLCGWMAAFTFPEKASNVALDYSQRKPLLALVVKWILYLFGGYCLAAAFHFARRVPPLEWPLLVRGFHVAREFLFALGFLLVVLLLSEPFLSQGSQKVDFPFRLRLPVVGNAVLAGTTGAKAPVMNAPSLLALLLFFVLQSLLYTASLIKLAEIRRQRVPPRVKLKLLDNEDHLFDAGLYLGFVGTIISLILFSLGLVKPSLMAAYSSTSFGILFVSCFKILNLRPLRRKLLLEAEASDLGRSASGAESALAAQL